MPTIGGTNSSSIDQYLPPSVPSNLMIVHRNEVILTAGSDLNVAAVSSGNRGLPWPHIVGTFMRRLFKGSWRPNDLVEVAHHNTPGNYGSHGGQVGYGFRGREFGGVGNMPGGNLSLSGAHSNPNRPTYNNLVPIVYGLRDIDPNQLAQANDLVQIQVLPVGNVQFVPAQSASLQEQLL